VQATWRFCPNCGAAISVVEPTVQRRVAVVFVDLVASTRFARSLSSDAYFDLMGEILTVLAVEIEALEGHVVQFQGDAVLAAFGAVKSFEDNALRAVKAARAAIAAVENYGERKGLELEGRAGVDTDEATVGWVGGEFTLFGSVVNLSRRLCSAAEPGEVLASSRVQLETHAGAQFEQQVGLVLRDYPEEGEPFLLKSFTTAAPQDYLPFHGPPLVGRQKELAKLEGLFRIARSERRVVWVEVVGHPGSGRSRLMQEFAARHEITEDARAVVLDAKTRKLELPTKVLPIILLEDALNLETALQTSLLSARKGALVLVPRATQSDREREAVILESFGFSQARTLLESLCGPQPIGLVKPWFERSLGNAAILAEVARLFNKGIDDTLELHNRLKTFALNHFEVFSSGSSEVFSVAALFGSGFYLDGLSQVLGRDVGPDLEILLKDGVILESSVSRIPGDHEFRIQIPLLREAAISVFELQHRVSLHLAISSWFSSRNSSRARDHTRAAQSLQAALLTQTVQQDSAVGEKNKKLPLVKVSRASKSPKQN
jgi:Adenylate and Guanylate cyclase catalytic domain/AAA ATPase domain